MGLNLELIKKVAQSRISLLKSGCSQEYLLMDNSDLTNGSQATFNAI